MWFHAKNAEEEAKFVADEIGRLTDQATLTRIARSDPEWSARSAAVRRLTDPATIAEIATKDPFVEYGISRRYLKTLGL